MPGSQTLVIDAGVALHAVLNTDLSAAAERAWTEFDRVGAHVFAPRLFVYEVTSVIQRYRFDGILSADESEEAIETASGFGVELVDDDLERCSAAMVWASRLRQKAAYDAFYVALAEHLRVDLWTADRRLANGLEAADGPPARWIGDFT
jgi:predicted nucleic acid-binding protein